MSLSDMKVNLRRQISFTSDLTKRKVQIFSNLIFNNNVPGLGRTAVFMLKLNYTEMEIICRNRSLLKDGLDFI